MDGLLVLHAKKNISVFVYLLTINPDNFVTPIVVIKNGWKATNLTTLNNTDVTTTRRTVPRLNTCIAYIQIDVVASDALA